MTDDKTELELVEKLPTELPFEFCVLLSSVACGTVKLVADDAVPAGGKLTLLRPSGDCGEPVGPESHNKVRFCLMESGESAAIQAGSQLYELRKLRNIADYDLKNASNRQGKNAATQVIVAQAVLNLLQSCRQEPAFTRFRTKVRDYAANVLRLPVT